MFILRQMRFDDVNRIKLILKSASTLKIIYILKDLIKFMP